jgi:high-affinity nickel permease
VRIENALKETQASISSLKTTMVVTAITSVLAIVLGIAAINATLLSNMVASFESGRNLSAAQAEVKRQAEETATLLRQLQDRMPPAPAAPPPQNK